jgi:hypothetical protein
MPLIEHFDGARVQTAGPRALQLHGRPPLDDRDVDSRQRQLAGQHHPGRTSAGDHQGTVGHRRTPFVAWGFDQAQPT